MYLVGWLYFLTWEKWPFVGDILCFLAAHAYLVTRAIRSRGTPMWAVWVLLLWQTDYCGRSGSCGWPLVWLIARPCLVQRLPVTGWQDWVMRQLSVEPWGWGPWASGDSLVGRVRVWG